MFLYKIILSVILCGFSHCLYSSSDDVIELDPNNFNNLVKGSDEIWLVEFYAPWCGHCQSLAPEWKKAASALKGIVKIGAVDADKHRDLGGQYGVSGFPTIKVFSSNKYTPTDYQGGRTARDIVDFGLREVQDLVKRRLGGGSSGGRSQGGSGGSDVVELTDSNFEETVLNSDEPWLVEFFAPWCGHCKNLKPHWEKAASELRGKVKMGALDATVYQTTASKYDVRGYPTIKFFPSGLKSGSPVNYDGGRSADDIVRWANDKVKVSIPPPEIKEITNNNVMKQACEDHQICIVAVLPTILDCQSKCRNEYIDILKNAGDKYKSNEWGWVWTEAVKQPKIEAAFSIGGFGYPALVAANVRKSKFATMRGPFSDYGVQEFIREVTLGRGATGPIQGDKLPEAITVEPWDGQDGKPPQEEEIDLSELGIETPKEDL